VSTTPWWGTALVAGLFGLVGVAVAQFVAVRLERTRHRREDTRRWHSERRQTYAEFLAATYTLYRHATDHWDDPDSSEEKALLREAVLKVQEVLLIASQPVADAAVNLHRRLHEGVKARTGDYAAFRSTIFEARELFHAAARAELGVSD
jgi:hypothetical protein